MPKILITGNGFDLNFGLPTSYNDFIKILNHLKRETSRDFESVYANSSAYAQILSTYNPFVFDYYKIGKLEEELQNNLWYSFFEGEFQLETWIDFETKIEYVLKALFSSIECIQVSIFSKTPLPINTNNQFNLELFNNDIEIIQILKKFKLIEFQNSARPIKLNSNYLIEKYGFYVGVNSDKISKYLYAELTRFKVIFNYYFEIFVFPLYDNLKGGTGQLQFLNMDKHYTFNYTPTFEKMFKKDATSFLHGKIDSEINQIVLGINEIPEGTRNKKHFLPFTKYFQKLNYGTDYAFIKHYEKKRSYNYIFFFWGHSLDTSDEAYINEVFEFIRGLKSNIRKIVVIYHNENSKSKLLLNLLSIRGQKDIEDFMKSENLLFVLNNSPELERLMNLDISNSIRSTVVYR